MYPVTAALLLSQELDDERRRAVAQRPRRFLEPEAIERPAPRPRVDVWVAIAGARRFAATG